MSAQDVQTICYPLQVKNAIVFHQPQEGRLTETQLYQDHVMRLRKLTAATLATEKYDALAIYAGDVQQFFADDQHLPFKPTPHFTHWCPLRSKGHVLLISGDEQPRLYLDDKPSYWIDTEVKLDTDWASSFCIAPIDAAKPTLQAIKNVAWIGPEVAWLPQHINCNPEPLRLRLDAGRSIKSEYEIACITAANRIAVRGHARLQECCAAGASELDLHLAYLQATEQRECDLPYINIIALDEKAAILHYQHKRKDVHNGKVLLADCGASVRGYVSDVSRTWTSKDIHPLFAQLSQAMERIQQELCAAVKSAVPFYDLHYQAHEKIATLLIETQLLRDVSCEEAIAEGLSKIFFPHGLGHLLGIQVHDVGGERLPCPYAKPLVRVFDPMRFKGKLAVNEVITIEPGLYFIPMLLDQQRDNPKLNHHLLDALRPYGGIRIEDNVLVKEDTAINLTRL